jgi:polyphenol oxidase
MSAEDFIRREFQGIPYYSCRAFENLPHLRHGFSTRRGGAQDLNESSLNLANAPWDSPARVNENRMRFLSALHLKDARLITLHQAHSNRVHIIEEISHQWNQSEGDALITRAENIALAVKTADCLPVLIADPATNAIAAVHSGWRGTLSGVLPQTIREMRRAFGSAPANLLIAIGPGIRSCCFEVGHEVVELFDKAFPGCDLAKAINARPGKFLLDLCGVLQIQLALAGVSPENRFDLGACTCCNTSEYFSYRAEGAASGRMMAVIGFGGGTVDKVAKGQSDFSLSPSTPYSATVPPAFRMLRRHLLRAGGEYWR